ncbi:MAG: 3-deoxy-7-phosphoheptulonate synthase [Chloroflexi bacterium]|nr:3-deoxy-7-phosphoheptulonate synthase [Chloroflexota bacterium]MYF21703.1 3-deoxy-7-phosphoheptulonate synthase [Chloroflexota bacterium]
MLIVMRMGATDEEVRGVLARLKEFNLEGHLSPGEERVVIGAVGVIGDPDIRTQMSRMSGVQEVIAISRPYKLTGREFQPEDTVIDVGGVKIGDGSMVVMAGPCSIENEEHMVTTARAVAASGAQILRGGAFKPRTSPYAFRGLGEEGLQHLATARDETGLPVITEVMEARDVELVARYADILQVGTRNMQNFMLLDEVGLARKPVMLKRGLSATIDEWLLAAEYIMAKGNRDVILCERGIRTFETTTRNTLDLSAIPVVKRLSHLPIVSDPAHGTGHWYLVEPMARASMAVGADGLMVEVHPNPDHALSDGPQSLTFENFDTLMRSLERVGEAVGHPLAPQSQLAAVAD